MFGFGTFPLSARFPGQSHTAVLDATITAALADFPEALDLL